MTDNGSADTFVADTFVADNRARFQFDRPTDHVESWFLRANHPTRARALWLKATILGRRGGESVAELWCSLFDGDRGWARGRKETVPIAEASFGEAPLEVEIAGGRFRFAPRGGEARGELDGGSISWDLGWRPLRGALGEPLCMLPARRLVDAALPKNKLLTPAPALRFSGKVRLAGQEEEWRIDDWIGMQGHNWGPAHAPQYAWGQCVFTDSQGEPFCMVEGAAGRIRIAGMLSPVLALMCIRHGGREYRFDRLLDLWNRRTSISFPDWTLRMAGPDGEALLAMRARPERMVQLGYNNPRGPTSYCLNSKLAAVSLRVNPVDGHGFECRSEHGGALEFLRGEAAAAIDEVV